jgi:hypothetical protein
MTTQTANSNTGNDPDKRAARINSSHPTPKVTPILRQIASTAVPTESFVPADDEPESYLDGSLCCRRHSRRQLCRPDK